MRAASLTPAQLRDLLSTLEAAATALETQRGNVVEGNVPRTAQAEDIAETIGRLRAQSQLLAPFVAELVELPHSTEPSAPAGTKVEHILAPAPGVVDEWEGTESRVGLRQYYIYYWEGVSRDQLNYWVFLWSDHPPTREEASPALERAIQEMGQGYWALVQDFTVPPDIGLLYRENRGISWDFDVGVQEQPVEIEPGEALIRKLKIEGWIENPEPQRPKEKKVRLSKLLGEP